MLLLLQAILRQSAPESLPDGYAMRSTHREDLVELGRLYFDSYDPGIGCPTIAEATADIELWMNDGYGEPWFEASPVMVHQGSIATAVQTVRSAPWPDVPTGPFITEVFTDRNHRRRGLARTALCDAMSTMASAGATSVSLRVMESNAEARLLYASLGFREVTRANTAP